MALTYTSSPEAIHAEMALRQRIEQKSDIETIPLQAADVVQNTLGQIEGFCLDRGDSPQLMASRMALASAVSVERVDVPVKDKLAQKYVYHYTEKLEWHRANDIPLNFKQVTEFTDGEIDMIATTALLIGDRDEVRRPSRRASSELLWEHWVKTGMVRPLSLPTEDQRAFYVANGVYKLLMHIK